MANVKWQMLERGGKRAGFSLIEIILVAFIMLVIASIAVSTFSAFRVNNALETSRNSVITALSSARNFTLFSKEATVYGVHFASSTVTVFKGPTYVEGAPTNRIYPIESAVNISHLSFTPFAYDVTFARLTGKPSTYGTITISAISDSSKQESVIIGASGLSE